MQVAFRLTNALSAELTISNSHKDIIASEVL